MINHDLTIIPLGGTRYSRRYHKEPCDYCDGARPWNKAYLTCPIHTILPCSCADLDWKQTFTHYCERHGYVQNEIGETLWTCAECKAKTLHSFKHSIFIGCDGGTSTYECLTCRAGIGYI